MYKRQVPNYYAAADAFITASTSETQGITYIEAMAAGLPLIAKYDDCLQSVLIDGYTGFMFENDSEIKSAILRCYNMSAEEKEKMRNNCYQKSSEYSLESFGESIIKVYFQAIARKQRIMESKSYKKADRERLAQIKKAQHRRKLFLKKNGHKYMAVQKKEKQDK